MTEAKWLAGSDPEPLRTFLRGKGPKPRSSSEVAQPWTPG